MESEAPSFDLWCMQIQQFPAARCLTRRSDDTAAYDQYRALVEQLAQQRAARDERDRELMDRLNRGPGDVEQ